VTTERLGDPAAAFRSEPLWQRAVEELRDWVTASGLLAGARLPSERALCERFGVSRMTLRKALLVLVEDAVLARDDRRGWFVAGQEAPGEWPNRLESFTETAARMGLQGASVVIRDAVSPATLDEAERLGVAPGALLHRIDRVRTLDGVPIAVDRSVVCGDAARVTAAGVTGSLFAALRRAGHGPVRADAAIAATACTAADADHLGVAVGSPVLVIDEVVHDHHDRPVMASVVVYAGDRYRLRTALARPTSG
jgi:GntR family transcriptional regulator